MSKWSIAILLASMSATGCFADDSTAPGSAAGSGGVGGTGGVGGSGGSGATGTGGSSASGGSTGSGGSSADSGTTGGSGGTGGSAGSGGSGGTAGTAGSGGSAGTGGSAGSAGSGGAGTGGASGAAGAAGMDAGCVQGTGPAALPFAVDEFFIASGWMGDVAAIRLESCGSTADAGTTDAGSTDAGSTDARPDAGVADAGAADVSLADARAPEAGPSDGGRIATAKCWAVTYTPSTDAGSAGWAGVDWQFPANNWGTMNGRVIPRGAKRVRFYAWGTVGGEVVSFNVGYGFTSPDLFGMTLANQILTTTPTAYEIDLTGIEYTCPSVRMGFGWTTAGALPVAFYIDDVEWQ